MVEFPSHKVFRANLDDVENLSYGKGAKKQRGTGSRYTCHRLNRDERRVFDQAKRDGILTVRGTGYRKNRKGSPVWNTFRQRCDALAQVCVVVERRSDWDRVVLDFSTLRVKDDSTLISFVLETVFQSNHPEFYNALMRNDHDDNNGRDSSNAGTELETADGCDRTSIIVENSTRNPIHWEVVKGTPIWGVDERLLVVTCDREVAKSIAVEARKVCNSASFAALQIDAESKTERILLDSMQAIEQAPQTKIAKSTGSMISCDDDRSAMELTSAKNCQNEDIDCIDWDDI